MTISLDIITRKKLILVKQLYQRALIQAELVHSFADRILALICFDLTNETILKAVVSSLNSYKVPANDFQGILQQDDNELASAKLPLVPSKVQILHIRTLRNDAQHKAKYPNEVDVSDCRTYTRDFLRQIILDVWEEDFDSISLIDEVQNTKVKQFLVEAESTLKAGDYVESVIKTIVSFDWTLSKIRESLVGRLPWRINSFIVSDSFDRTEKSKDVYDSFKRMQDLLMKTIIGLHFAGHLKFTKLTRSVGFISFAADGSYVTLLKGHKPTQEEAEFILDFATNAIIQIESLVGDIDNPFNN